MNSSLRAAMLFLMVAPAAWAATPVPTIQVYKSPTCGCCGKWIDYMKASGFEVVTHETNNVAEHKARLGVPLAMGSCHTAEINGYFVEGHVPAADVKKLLAEKPRARGVVSPGMPASAPGMNISGNTPYDILLVRSDGGTTTYARH